MSEWEGDSLSWWAVLLLWVCFWMSHPVQGKSLAVFLQSQWLVSIQREIITVSWMLCMCVKRGGHRDRGFCSRQKEARRDISDHLNTHFFLSCFIWRSHSRTPKCLLHIKAGVRARVRWFHIWFSCPQHKLTSFPSSLVSFLSELPYGWEKIDDPIYGSYYVE